MRNPLRLTLLSQDLDRGDSFEKDVSRIEFLTYGFYLSAKTRAGRDTGVIEGAGGGGIRPTTDEQPRTVMRNPMRDPMRDNDSMVPGDVDASTPLPSSTREHRIQFASRTQELPD